MRRIVGVRLEQDERRVGKHFRGEPRPAAAIGADVVDRGRRETQRLEAQQRIAMGELFGLALHPRQPRQRARKKIRHRSAERAADGRRPVSARRRVSRSMRSAAALMAAATSACSASVRPAAAMRSCWRPSISSSTRRMRWRASAQLVGEEQRRHDGEPHVADLAEGRAQLGDALVEFVGEPGEMVLLAVVAGHAILAAADGYADMSHDQVSLRVLGTRPSTPLQR